MLAIGVLSFLSAGFAVMSFNDGTEDPTDPFSPHGDDTSDQTLAEPQHAEQDLSGVLDLFPFQTSDLDQALPEADTQAGVGSQQVSSQETDSFAGDADDRARVNALAPVEDAANTPWFGAEELDPQPVLEEFAATLAQQPPNLVTVSDGLGNEVDDLMVVQQADAGAEQTHIVTAPQGENAIDVRYDPEAAFEINYSAETTHVTAGLNSDISGPEALLKLGRVEGVDEAGRSYTEVLLTQSFEGQTSITVDVAQDHIGTWVADIDLSNPADTLSFNFADDVSGNLHLVVHTNDDHEIGQTRSTRMAYIVQTAAEHETLSTTDINTMVNDGDLPAGMHMLARVYLGQETMASVMPEDDTAPYGVQISNFMNDDADIGANIAWASLRETDDSIADDAAQEARPAPKSDPFGTAGLPFNGVSNSDYSSAALAA